MGGSSNFEVSAPKVSVPFGHLHDGNSWLRALIAATNCKVIKFIKKQRKYATTHNTTLQRHWRASCERQCKFHFVGRLTFAFALALAVQQPFCKSYSKHFENNARLPLYIAELDSVACVCKLQVFRWCWLMFGQLPKTGSPPPLVISRLHYQLKQLQTETTANGAAPASFGRPQLVVTCDCFELFSALVIFGHGRSLTSANNSHRFCVITMG